MAFVLCVALLTATLAVAPASSAEVSGSGILSGNLRSVAFVSATTGFAAADSGAIIKTTDGGDSWTQVRATDAYSFRGIDFWDASKGVAVDWYGKVASTTDGGVTWTNVNFSPDPDMDGPTISNPNRTHHDVACEPGGTAAIAAAGDEAPGDGDWTSATSMRTSGNLKYWLNPLIQTDPHLWYNAGDLTWYPEGIGELLDVEYVGSSTVWASGIDYWTLETAKYPLFKSTDGGVTYTKITSFGTNNLRLEGVAFGSTSAGILVGQVVGGNRCAYYTTDGGVTWPAATTLPGTAVLNAVDMSSATQGWAVSSDGGIIRTADGGNTWTACTITGGNANALYDVEFISGTTTGWAVGASGTVLLTTDGITWRQPTDGTVNHAPVAVADSYTTDNATAKVVAAPGVLTNDTDADSDPLTAIKVTDPSHGVLTAFGSDGSFTYTPTLGYVGEDSFTYKANDGAADSNTVTVTITVTAPNVAPVAVADSYTTAEDTPKVVAAPGVLANDTDADSDPLTAIKVTDPSHGTLTAFGSDGSFTYAPAANYVGEDSFTYKANDGEHDSNTVTVTLTITAVNDAPVAVADSYTTAEDTPKVVAAPGVLTNDTDVDGDPLTAVKVTNPSHGTLTAFGSDGSFTYTPTANWSGTDSFTYRAYDGTAYSNTVTVTLTVTAVNDAPVAVADSYTAVGDTPRVVSAPGVLTNDTDAESDPLTAIKVTDPSHGTLTAFGSDGSFTYVRGAGYVGEDSFTYKANDGTADSNTVTVTITVTESNEAPVAVADSYTTAEDTTKIVAAPGVLTNDTDGDGDPLTAIKVTNPSHGTLTAFNADGSFTYVPTANWSGTDSFTYRAYDGTAYSNTVTVTLTVTAVNDAPVAVAESYTTAEDTALTVAAPGVLTNDTDIDSGTLTAIKVTNPSNGTLTLNANGSFTYVPAADYNGTDSFTYRASDGTLSSNTVTVTLTVTPVDDPVPVTLVPVYRFYNFTNNTHFFTPSSTERDMVMATWSNVFRYEGVAYYTNPANNTQPLYRFYNRVSASHFYTASDDEAATILARWSNVYSLDGRTYAVSPGAVPNSIPVYRFYNLTNGSHFYTASLDERNMVMATWPKVYRYEGEAFWLGQ